MQPVDAFGAPVMVIVDPVAVISDRQQRYTNMKSDLAQKLITFGSLQIVCGILCLVFQLVLLPLYSSLAGFDGHGIWGGVMFMITGPFGIIGGKRRIKGCVITFNVLSILSTVFAGASFSFAVMTAHVNNVIVLSSLETRNYPSFEETTLFNDSEYSFKNNSSFEEHNKAAKIIIVGIAMESMIACFALAEGIVAILSSVVCCTIGACCCEYSGNCCCPPSFKPMMITNQQLMRITNQQLMMTTSQQPMMITNQEPMMTVNQQPMPCPYSYEIQQPSAERYDHMGKEYDNSEYSYA